MTAFPPVPLVESIAAPLLRANIDTDAIIPSREIKGVGKTGLADGLFADWRYVAPGSRDPVGAFVLNDPVFKDANILLAGENFGCGSSREHAVWALHEYGFRAVIAPSFAPIFRGNAIRNGVVPVVLSADAIGRIAALGADITVTVNLIAQQVCAGDMVFAFSIDPQAREMLAEGLDAIDGTMKMRADIDAFLDRDRMARPWVYFSEAM